MPRLSRVARNQVSEATADIFDRYNRQRGNVPNMFRTVAHRPEIFATMIAHFEAVLNTGTLPLRLKELVIVRTSQMNECAYCLASHTAICRNLGWTDEQLAHLASYESRDDFSPAEKAALHLAEKMTCEANEYTDAEFTRLRSFYDEGEVVELMAAIGLFNYFNRFNNLLQMEPTTAAAASDKLEHTSV